MCLTNTTLYHQLSFLPEAVFSFKFRFCETCPLSHFPPLRDHEAEIDAIMGHRKTFKSIKDNDDAGCGDTA